MVAFALFIVVRPNVLPFSGVGAAKPATRFYADVSAATTAAATGSMAVARGPVQFTEQRNHSKTLSRRRAI
jgi:hypothetical protein